MGCGQSKIESEEAVTRCKDRKEFMKKAVSSRNAFAAAHAGYTVSLKNTGAALSDYGQGEVDHTIPVPSSSSSSSASAPSSSSSASASIPSSSSSVVQPPIDTPLPPPPLPPLHPAEFTPPLQRAASMPDLPIPKKHPKPPADDSIQEEDGDADDEDEDAEDEHRRRNSRSYEGDARPVPPPPAPAPAEASGSGKPQAAAASGPTVWHSDYLPAEASGSGKPQVWLSDFFFNTANMPVPSLSQPEPEPEPERIPPPAAAAATKVRENDIREIPHEKLVTEPIMPPPPPPPPPVAVQQPPPQQPQPPKQLKKQKPLHHQHAVPAGGESRRGKMVTHAGPSVNLLQVLEALDDHFLKASESAHEVSKMLEATRMHYHTNFADNRGYIDHSARVMRVITWNRSCKGLKDEDVGKDDFDNEESETHATILDKMLAWEKKLYDEVKAGELMKIEYQRKVATLNKQKKRGASPETLEKTKAAVSHLHTRYIVDMQSMDSTVAEINRLRDKQLYPKLTALVDAMANMWETMFVHHRSQLTIAADLRNLDVSLSLKETSNQHHERTVQLYKVLQEWHSQFQNLMKFQREYVQALNSWLKLNLIPIESNLKEKVSSPQRVTRPAIQPLLNAWQDHLEKLPDERPRNIIHIFAEVVHTILIIQDDELKLKEKLEDTRREYTKRSRAFDDWFQKYSEKKAAAAAAAAAAAEDDSAAVANLESRVTTNQDDEIVAERKGVVDALMTRCKEYEESYQRTCKQVRVKSVGSLKTHLPELFRAMSEFALECSEMYKKLRSITSELQDAEELD